MRSDCISSPGRPSTNCTHIYSKMHRKFVIIIVVEAHYSVYIQNYVYHIAGYIGGNNVWRIARKLQLADKNLAVTGSRGTIATPSPGVYEPSGTILVDLILAV